MKYPTCLLASLPLSVILAESLPAAIPAPQVEALNTGQGEASLAKAVSADGSVIGGIVVPTVYERPFVWTRSGGARVLDFPGGLFGTVTDISDDGSRLLGIGSGSSELVVWNTATGLPLPSPSLPVYRCNISGDGTTVAGSYSSGGPGQLRAFRWPIGSSVEDLGTLGGAESEAHAIGRRGGLVVGRSRDASGEWRAFHWTEGAGMEPIPGVGGRRSSALGMSGDGAVIVGKYADPGGNDRGFRWTAAGGVQDLGTPAASWLYDVKISDDGSSIAGTYYELSRARHRAFRWTSSWGYTPLAPGLQLFVNGISRDGGVIVGSNLANSSWRSVPIRWTEEGGVEELPGLGLGADSCDHVSLDGSTAVGSGYPLSNGLLRALRWHESGTIGRTFCHRDEPNSTGAVGTMGLSGSNVISSENLVLQAHGLPPHSVAIFLLSNGDGVSFNYPWKQFGICLSDPVTLLNAPSEVQSTGLNGSVRLELNPALLGGGSAMVGQNLYFTGWYRDSTGTVLSSRITNAASVELR